MNFTRTLPKAILATLVATALASCGFGGGSGGGDGSQRSAYVILDVTPDYIDTDDITLVTTWINDVHENGLELKFHPEELQYLTDTAFLEVDGEQINVSPSFNVQRGNKRFYLVFFLPRSIFSKGGDGILTFQLRGVGAIEDEIIEVDPDLNNPDIANSVEFNQSDPEFSAEDLDYITVVN